MRYENVCLEAIAYSLPDEVVTSSQIETRLSPLYERLGLPEGRLELMTGIVERRFWPPGTLPGQVSAQTAEKALRLAAIDRAELGALVHGSVCRDRLEPATACSVHERLGLGAECLIYDVSNACLGLLNGMVQVADMIELGRIRAGLVVGTEDGRTLVESTIAWLNREMSLTRADVKRAFASLTIGSASAALVLVDRRLSRTGNRLLGGAARSYTAHCRLCQGSEVHMETDAETLLQEGVRAACQTYPAMLAECGWTGVDKVFCHQVGKNHQKLLLGGLGIDPALDYSTVEWLGNTGAAALPVAAALGVENGHLQPGDRLGLLGIGSGINVLMLGVGWQ